MKRNLNRKLLITFLMTVIFSALAFGNVEQRRKELFKILDEEIREVSRLNRQSASGKPDLLLRLAQLLLEKGRLLKDEENQKYLDTPAQERDKIDRESLYRESRRYFDQAQKTVLVLLDKFPNFDEKADAYYILAYNAKELKQEEESKKFFQKALDESPGESVIADKSRIALAEMYFNKGSFDKSMTLYEAALKNKRDKWWTKDAFNLAWCYFKMGKFDKAISLMTQSYELSKNNTYIDMSRSIERDLAFFYTEAGRAEDAIAFYKSIGKSVSEVMLKVGRYLKSQGKFAAAEKTLVEGLQFKQSEKEEIEFNTELLNLYEKFGRDQKHLEACRMLVKNFSKGLLNSEQVEILKFNTQKMAALIQQQLVNRTYDHQPEIKNKKAASALEYFVFNSILEPQKAHEDYFHAGETFFALSEFDQAIPLYTEAIARAKKNNDKKIEGLASNALMVSLSKDVKKTTSDKYLIPAYENFLGYNPKGEKSAVIYQRLFSAHLEKKNVSDAEKVLLTFRNQMPSEKLPQEGMLAEIMDFHKDKGDQVSLNNWVKKIEAKEFDVSPEFNAKIRALVLGMQFEKVEKASEKGDKKAALRGYLKIYYASNSTDEAKSSASYNIAVLLFEAGKVKGMSAWAGRAVSLQTPAEIIKFERNYIYFVMDLFQRRQYNESAQLSEKIFEKLCSVKSKNKKVFFKNANVLYLSERNFDKSRNLLAKASKCGLSEENVLAGYIDHLNELALAGKWGSYFETLKFLETSRNQLAHLIYPSSLLANELEKIGRTEDAKKIQSKMMSFFDSARAAKVDVPAEGLEAIALIRLSRLESNAKKLYASKFVFPKKEFYKTLKNKFKILDQITAEAVAIAELGSGVGIVKSYRLLVESHEGLVAEVSQFTPPKLDQAASESFRDELQKICQPILEQAQDFRLTAVEKINKENILSDDNSWFLSKNAKGFVPEYYSEKSPVIMDKAGAL